MGNGPRFDTRFPGLESPANAHNRCLGKAVTMMAHEPVSSVSHAASIAVVFAGNNRGFGQKPRKRSKTVFSAPG
jgi:hypothetical protein